MFMCISACVYVYSQKSISITQVQQTIVTPAPSFKELCPWSPIPHQFFLKNFLSPLTTIMKIFPIANTTI